MTSKLLFLVLSSLIGAALYLAVLPVLALLLDWGGSSMHGLSFLGFYVLCWPWIGGFGLLCGLSVAIQARESSYLLVLKQLALSHAKIVGGLVGAALLFGVLLKILG